MPRYGLPVREKSIWSGSFTGSALSGNATTPHLAQCTTGIGQPQGRWRDTSQSRRRKFTVRSPMPAFSSRAAISFLASSTDMPSRKREFASLPGPV